jgi:hypothetical protein
MPAGWRQSSVDSSTPAAELPAVVTTKAIVHSWWMSQWQDSQNEDSVLSSGIRGSRSESLWGLYTADFFHVQRETSILVGELLEESEQFRFLWTSRLANLKGSVGLILTNASGIRVTIPIDLSTWSFIPLPRFFNSRRVSPLLDVNLWS